MNFDLFGELELVEIKPGGGQRNVKRLTISPQKTVLRISKGLMDDLPWGEKERVNLYVCGNMFVLKKAKTGLINVSRTTDGSGRITNRNLCLEIMSRCKSRGQRWFEGEVQEDAIFFKSTEGSDE